MDKLKQCRKARHLSQQQLADALEVSRSAVAMWETGGSSPDRAMILRLAAFFGVTTDYLLGLSNQRQPPAGQRETGQTGCLTRMEKSRPKMKACCDKKHGESGQQEASGPERRT